MVDLLIKQSRLADDPVWQSRVRLAMFKTMTAVQGEVQTGTTPFTKWEKRQKLASAVLAQPSAYVDRFAWAAATNATIATAIANPISITSSTNATPIVVTTPTHGYTTGDTVSIAGHTVNTNANGGWIITVLTTTTFSIPMNGNGIGAASGSVTKQPNDSDLQFVMDSFVDDFAGVVITD